MDKLVSNLYQKVPIQHVAIPDEIDPEVLLESLEKISAENPYYVKRFLNKLFQAEIDQDEFYELFAQVLNAQPLDVTQPEIITYTIDDVQIQIKETPRVISGAGTTGLRTWEAALYLSNFISSNEKIISQKSVLELGTGTGIVSLYTLLQQKIQVNDLVITDGEGSLVESLGDNFQLNNLDISKTRCHTLWWGTDPVPKDIDVILAADVTYDSSVIPSLVDCLRTGLSQGVKEAYIAATIRNEDTIKSFEQTLDEVCLQWEIIDRCVKPGELETSSVWYAPATPEIRIYKIN